MKTYSKIIIVMIFIFLNIGNLASQTQIQLVRAKTLEYDENIKKDVKRIIGDVVFEHDGAILYCDSAWLYDKTNSVDAFGKILIQVNDTVSITGEFINYDGNTKIANIEKNVVMKDNNSTLKSNKILFDRNTNLAFYNTGGELKDFENTLTSKIGTYNTQTKIVYFKKDVVLINPRFKLECDTLIFDLNTEIAYFPSKTVGLSNENYMYCEDGWYETRTDITMLKVNAYLNNKKQTIKGDSIYFEQKTKYGEAWSNVILFDSIQNIILSGNFCKLNNQEGYSFLTDKALAEMIDQNDTLFLHADTIKMTFDTAQTARFIFAYHHCFFYREDLQGYTDSLTYSVVDSIIFMNRNPVIWAEENQLKADTITIFMKNQQFDKILMNGFAFISNKIDDVRFNQIKGKNMTGYLKNNDLYKIDVEGNAESLYFIEENNKQLIGVNKTESSFMTLLLENNNFSTITVSGSPKAIMYPWDKMTLEEKILKNFIWLSDFRPNSYPDLFILHDNLVDGKISFIKDKKRNK